MVRLTHNKALCHVRDVLWRDVTSGIVELQHNAPDESCQSHMRT